MDHAATTPTDTEVVKEMEPYFTQKYGNPNSVHSFGQEAREAVEEARGKVAHLIGANPSEIVFTAGGTESDNYTIKGIAWANQKKGNHIVTSKIEHHAVLHSCQFLEKQGFKVTYLPVDKYGLIDPEDVKKAITDKTILVTIMHANNEIGTIEPIKEIGKVVKKAGIYFHTDSVQTTGHIPIDVNDLGVDLLSISGHKFYGPNGVGVLYLRKGTKIVTLIDGGSQEKNRRAGTENVAGIVGFAEAVKIAHESMEENYEKAASLKKHLWHGLVSNGIEGIIQNSSQESSPYILSITFDPTIYKNDSEAILMFLDINGIAVSAGSACTSGTLKPSHVILAAGYSEEYAKGTLRFSFSNENKFEEIDYTIDILTQLAGKLKK